MFAYLTTLMFVAALELPFAESLAVPLDWFAEQNVFVQVIVGLFSVLGFYLMLRLVFKIVEKIAGIFG